MDTVLFVNTTIGCSENLFLVIIIIIIRVQKEFSNKQMSF